MYSNRRPQIVIITALDKEFDALKFIFPELKDDNNCERILNRKYYFFEIESSDGKTYADVAFVCAGEMGRVSASLATRDAIYHLSPEYIILTGIAASAPSTELRLGHVAYSTKVKDYELPKVTPNGIEWRIQDFPCSKTLIDICKELQYANWHGNIPHEIRMMHPLYPNESHGGKPVIVACGDKVISDPKMRDVILKACGCNNTNVCAIEMESAGCCQAIFKPEGGNLPEFIMIKGICDYADYYKKDDYQKYAAIIAGFCLKQLILQFLKNKMGKKKTAHEEEDYGEESEVILAPSKNARMMLRQFPQDICRDWNYNVIDGAVEVLRTPGPFKAYSGYGRNSIICTPHNDYEWPSSAKFDEHLEERLRKLSIGLIGDGKSVQGWLGGRQGRPNRIRVLTKPFTQIIEDNPFIKIDIGNSDYFTVRTIQEIANRECEDPNSDLHIGDIFPGRWARPGEEFPINSIPYHISAQGIVVCREPHTRNKYLILAAGNPRHNTLVYGWGATMAEQMQGPEPAFSLTEWWKPYLDSRDIKTIRDQREGDAHIQDTLIRGLGSELGLIEGDHYKKDPKLLSVCLEENMYFFTFIFFVEANISLDKLRDCWLKARDGKEIFLLAAFQIEGEDEEGNKIDGPKRFAELLSYDKFDGSNYLLEPPTLEEYIKDCNDKEKERLSIQYSEKYPKAFLGQADSRCNPMPWHISSRMRIYVAACHLWGKEFEKYIRILKA